MDDTKTADVEDEGKQPVELPTTEKPAEVSAPPEEESRPEESEGELPEGVKERTRQEFEKLKETNRKLAEKLNAYEKPKQPRRSALDMFAPREQVTNPQPMTNPMFAQQAQEPQMEEIKPIAPDSDGYIDVNVLNSTIAQINERNRKIAEEARIAREEAKKTHETVAKFEHTEKTLKTYAKHPYLDPTNDSFDQKFSDLVRKELLDQMINEGREDYLEAANKVKELYYDPTPKTEEPKPQENLKQEQNVAKRDQINALQGTKQGDDEIDHQNLVQRSRLGDKDAIYERLKRSGY